MRRALDMTDDRDSRASPPRAEISREFPDHAATWTDPVTRREFMTLMGASLALAGASGCNMREPNELIIPYVRKPEQETPGKPLFYATAMPHDGAAIGLLVESHAGRPTKIEGNPQHPGSRGATDAFCQASILTLYDPDRSKSLRYLGRIRGWNDALTELQKEMSRPGGLRETKGRGFRILSEVITSPALAAQREALLRTFPEARWHQYEPTLIGSGHAGTGVAFGEPLDAQYRFADAKVVLTLDADPFGAGPGHLIYAGDFMKRRRSLSAGEMNRFYAVESAPIAAGMRADHRLPMRASQVENIARAFAAELGVTDDRVEFPESTRKWLHAVADDLRKADNQGKSIVVPGEFQPPAVHAIAHAINSKLGNIGKTVVFTRPVNVDPVDRVSSLGSLCEEMGHGDVHMLLILGGNPVFDAPADFKFLERLQKVPLRVRLGLYEDETSRWCQWHLPEAHYLETWGDCRAYDGTCTIMQPLIAPLYGGLSALETVALFSDEPVQTGHEIVKQHWQKYHADQKIAGSFDQFWRKSIHDGIVASTAFPVRNVTLRDGWHNAAASDGRQPPGNATTAYELILRPDPTIHDGRFANNSWLQELPKPLTKLTWDNAAIVSPATAEALGLKNTPGWHGGPHGEMITDTVNISYSAKGRSFSLSGVGVVILPSHPDGAVTLHFGYGRTAAGQVGTGVGVDVYPLRTSANPFFIQNASIVPTGAKAVLAVIQNLYMVQSDEALRRGTVRSGTLDEYEHDKQFAIHGHYHENGPLPTVGGFGKPDKPPAIGSEPLDLYPGFKYDGYKWGMVVDTNACIGCGGCVIACQSENNIPVVGKTEVTRARIMHWLRIDEFFQGDPAKPESMSAIYQPLMCLQCENAPCEVVCPVEATSHSTDGLNEMTYNRCVGTRYCSNNCPYKVRRFNFLFFADYVTESLKLQRNPEVTVRSRGVMEKCTFCVQRIRSAEIEAKNRNAYGQDPNRPDIAFIRDGEILTACQAACPTQAIVFGDMNDVHSQVAALKRDDRSYGLLSDLNTRPRLTHLAVVRNPNPDLEPKAATHA